MRSFIIHMSSSTARRANARQLLADLPQAELVEAVNGRDPAQIADVSLTNGDLFRPHYPFALRAAEIGVFQSHRRCWQRIIDENLDFALIVEDDLGTDPERLSDALDLAATHVDSDMYIRLPVKQRETAVQTLASRDGLNLILPRVIGLQCTCQIVGRGAAARLLRASETIDRPVDTFLQMHWITGQPIHALKGTGNREIAHEIGGSTIQTKTRASGKLARELGRAWYRAQVALRPQRPRT